MHMMYTVSFILFRSLFFFRLPLSSFTAVGTPVAVLSSRLAANAVGRPSFSGWSTCRRNCSGCADSQNLIFSQPAHAVRRRRMWWSIRSSSRRRLKMIVLAGIVVTVAAPLHLQEVLIADVSFSLSQLACGPPASDVVHSFDYRR